MAKTLVVLCDGTGKQYGEHNTNVVHAYELMLGREAGQLVAYDPGVGTFAPKWLESRISDLPGTVLSKAFGYGLRENLRDTYEFLMAHYAEGDRVILMGFSRGAFTVRCLAGALMRCGLLWPHEENLVPYVIRHYFDSWSWDDGPSGRAKAETLKGFKATFTRACVPQVVAVWDTVNAYGLVSGAKFPNSRLHPEIPFGFQALALDEFRVKFRPSIWQPPAEGQTIEQVWFAGAHSDVGGGYPARGLSDIALEWLLEKCEAHGLGLVTGWREAVSGDPLGELHDETRKPGWRLVNRAYRLFGVPEARTVPPDAVYHPSVDARRQAMPDYRPGSR